VTEIAARHRSSPRPLGLGPARYVLAVVALAVVYDGSAQLSYFLNFAGPVAAIVWLPVGVGIAFIYFGGLALLPGVAIGDLLANDYGTLPFWSAIGQSVGNVLEVAVAALLISHFARRGRPHDSVTGLCLLLLALSTGVAVSATVGSISLWLGGVITASDLGTVWRTWWLGDACGALLVVPAALAWSDAEIRLSRGRALEAGAMIAGVAVLMEIPSQSHRSLVYIVFPALIWAALRFGARGATLAVGVAAGLVIVNSTSYHGAFVEGSLSHSVHTIQLFIGVSAVTTLLLAAAVAERRRFAAELARSRARIVDAGQQERRRLERDLHDGAQQRLTWLAVRLHRAAEVSQTTDGPDPDLLREAESELDKAIEELRTLARGLHPAVLTDLGLAAAVRSASLRTSIPVVAVDIPDVRLNERIEAAAYFVFTEAVTNAQKHSEAGSIRVHGTVSTDVLQIEIADDGRGGADQDGHGMQGMRDRVESLRGTLTVESEPGCGTRVIAAIPLATLRGRDR
jgi:signal transduction histidine kinase